MNKTTFPNNIDLIAKFISVTGLPIIPCVADHFKKKKPLTDYLNATKDISVIKKWSYQMLWTPGVPVGLISGIAVVDISAENFEETHQWFLEKLEENDEPISPMYQNTPSGGRHYFYLHSSAMRKINAHGKPIDVYATSGHVVLYLDNLVFCEMEKLPIYPHFL